MFSKRLNQLQISKKSSFLLGLFCCLFLSFQNGQAQQIPLYAQYYLNPSILNPAYVGDDSLTSAFLLYRNQWAGIQGSPEMQVLTLNGRIGKKDMGIGGMAFHDQANVINKSGGYLTYTYRVELSAEHSLRAGLSMGVVNSRIDFDKIQAENSTESTLLMQSQNRSKVDANFGLLYRYSNRLELGLSALQLLNSKFSYTDQANAKATNYLLIRHYFITAKYHFDIPTKQIQLNPLLMLRSAQGTPFQWDLGVEAIWRNFIWLTPMYRSHYGMALSAGVNVNENLKVGYAYETATNGIAKQSAGTHEVVVGYTFRRKNQAQVPSSEQEAFVMPSTEAIEKKIKLLEHKVDSLSTELVEFKEEYKQHIADFDSMVIRKKEMFEKVEKNVQELADKQQNIEELRKVHLAKRKELHQFMEDEHITLAKLDTFNINRWDFYVVVGTFSDFNYAKFIQKVYQRDFKLATKIKKSATNDYYVIWTKQVFKKEEAQIEIDRINNSIDDTYLEDGAWLYHTPK